MTKSIGSFEVTGFDHTRLVVADLKRSHAFYEQYFGFEVVAEAGPTRSEEMDILVAPGVAVSLIMGRVCGHLVELLQYDEVPMNPRSARPSLGPSGFSVTVSDIEKAWTIAEEGQITITPKILEVMGTKLFFVKDPDGNYVELIEYADGHHAEW